MNYAYRHRQHTRFVWLVPCPRCTNSTEPFIGPLPLYLVGKGERSTDLDRAGHRDLSSSDDIEVRLELLGQRQTQLVASAHLEGKGGGAIHLPLSADGAVRGGRSVQLASNLHGEGGGPVQLGEGRGGAK